MLIITVVALAINAACAASIRSADGARGAAVGTLVADMIGLVATGYAVSRLGLPVGRWLAVVPRVALAVAPAIAMWFVPVPDLAKAALAAVIYGAMVLIVRVIPPELMVELRRLRQSVT